MNGALKETLHEQAALREEEQLEGEELELAEIIPSLTFSLRGQDFTCRLDEVKEVTEVLPITPYPFQVKGHIGLVNLRGKVTPVVCPLFTEEQVFVAYDETEFENFNQNKYRLIIFHEEDGEDFAILAQEVTKRRSSFSQWQGQDIINMSGHPYKVFRREDVKSIYKEAK